MEFIGVSWVVMMNPTGSTRRQGGAILHRCLVALERVLWAPELPQLRCETLGRSIKQLCE